MIVLFTTDFFILDPRKQSFEGLVMRPGDCCLHLVPISKKNDFKLSFLIATLCVHVCQINNFSFFSDLFFFFAVYVFDKKLSLN